MEKTDLGTAENPNWDGAGFDYYKWFKAFHLDTLEKYQNLIDEQYNSLPLGKAYNQDNIKLLLDYLDQLLKLYKWLPKGEGGKETMDALKKDRNQLEQLYLNRETNDNSFWLAQEIKMKVFSITNNMDALCED